MALQPSERIDFVNILLMLISCAVAIYIPFELFLFSYAILGPLHYLTEISWLHDKNYYTKQRYDVIILLAAGVILTLKFLQTDIELEFPVHFDANILYVALLSSLILVTVKNRFYKIAGIALLILTSSLSHNFIVFFTIFLPTIIHVYLFTGLFMLYGALKSNSRLGILSVFVLVLCPFILYNVFPDKAFHLPATSSIKAMEGFKIVNINMFLTMFGYQKQPSVAAWDDLIFHSKTGILIMRFIAFAYTYHYLNWFSKTRVIQWHKVPKLRFALVLLVWAASVSLYLYDYTTGLKWLFFLSFLHVLLEFPLNFTSIIGIGKHFTGKVLKPGISKA